jgi:hypothetical protein
VTKIQDGTFSDCAAMKSISMPSITKIGKWAFSGCTGLEDVVIPDSVTTIGERAFEDCPFQPDQDRFHLQSVDSNAQENELWNRRLKNAMTIELLETDLNDPDDNMDYDDYLCKMVSGIVENYDRWLTRKYMWLMKERRPEKGTKFESATSIEFNGFSKRLLHSLENSSNNPEDINLQNDVLQAVLEILKWGKFPIKPGEKTRAPEDFTRALIAIKNANRDLTTKEILVQGKVPGNSNTDSSWRIAFWSKCLAAYQPGACFIYDSRVSFALSYISWKLNLSCFWAILGDRGVSTDNKCFRGAEGMSIKEAIAKNLTDTNSENKSVPKCYDLYLKLLKKLSDRKVIQDKYLYTNNSVINDDIRNAYNNIFPIADEDRNSDDIVRDKDGCPLVSKKAIMAHLEKMLFMMKEHILQEYQPGA